MDEYSTARNSRDKCYSSELTLFRLDAPTFLRRPSNMLRHCVA